jgi:hypothetical protein
MPKAQSPKPIKRFTHGELQQAITLELARRGLDLATPSAATVKQWSSTRQIDQADAIEAQARKAVDRMAARERYYAGKPKNSTQRQPQSRAPAPEQLDQVLSLVTSLAAEVRALKGALEEQRRTPLRQGPPPDHAQGQSELARAIDQLDGVRKHLLARFDAELTLLRQLAASSHAQGPTSPGVDLRLEGRLSRIEKSHAQLWALMSREHDADASAGQA